MSTCSSPWKHLLTASFLSLLCNGLGQLYNRQFGRALVVAFIGPAIDITGGLLGAYHALTTLALMLGFALVWKAIVVTDAFRVARMRSASVQAPLPKSHLIFGMLVTIGIPFALYGDFFFNHVAHARGYRVPSLSMCPTVCKGERMIADPSAFHAQSPKRGDLIMFRHEEESALFIKRVVGLPGDTVSDANGTILVNGQPAATLNFSRLCGNPPLDPDPPARTTIHNPFVLIIIQTAPPASPFF